MRWILSLWVVCWFCLSGAPAALAQSDAARSASARALFEEGVKSADAGQWVDAADRFQRALSLRDSQVIRYNLAAALAELGRVVEASELLRQVERDPATDGQLRADAQTKLEVVSGRIAKLTVELDAPATDVSVMLDETRLDAAMIGVGIPVDPGDHSLRALRGNEALDEQRVTLADGAEQKVLLLTSKVATPAEAARTVVAAQPTPAPQPKEDKDGRRSKLLWWGVGGGAVAVAAIVVVSVLVASSGESSAKTYQGDFDPPTVPVEVGP